MDRRGGSVTINPANLSTMKIYGQSKRRQDLARLPEEAGAGADQMTLDTGFRSLQLPGREAPDVQAERA
jgi:hypothetical protein